MGCWDSFLDWLEWVVCGQEYTATHRGASRRTRTASPPTTEYFPRHEYPLSYPTRRDTPQYPPPPTTTSPRRPYVPYPVEPYRPPSPVSAPTESYPPPRVPTTTPPRRPYVPYPVEPYRSPSSVSAPTESYPPRAHKHPSSARLRPERPPVVIVRPLRQPSSPLPRYSAPSLSPSLSPSSPSPSPSPSLPSPSPPYPVLSSPVSQPQERPRLTISTPPLRDDSVLQPTSPVYPTSPSSPRSDTQDYNQLNIKNEYYVSLRARAREARDEMDRALFEGNRAYNSHNHVLAREMSRQRKWYRAEMIQLNKQASDWIFRENNMHCAPNEIDLHGLTVPEATARTDRAIEEAKRNGASNVRVIVGKGLHTTNGAPKLKPAVVKRMRKQQRSTQIDPRNAGVLVIDTTS